MFFLRWFLGIFGLLFYFYYNVIILKWIFLKLKKQLPYRDNLINMMSATLIAVFLMSFIISLSGSFGAVTFNTIRSIYLGAILGIFNNIIVTDKINKNSNLCLEK